MVAQAELETSVGSRNVPGKWGLRLSTHEAEQVSEAVLAFLELEPHCGWQSDDPFLWARALHALGYAEDSQQVVNATWSAQPPILRAVQALLGIPGATWQHLRLVEAGILGLRRDVLGTGRDTWTLDIRALAAQVPALYELAEQRVASALHELLRPLLTGGASDPVIQLCNPVAAENGRKWRQAILGGLQLPQPVHVFCTPC